MSKLYVVRHGQASYYGSDYDVLSPRGHEQVALLGRYWAPRMRPDRVIVGPRRRHRDTEQGVRRAYEAVGAPLPVAEVVGALDEFPGLELMQRAAPLLAEKDPEMASALAAAATGGPEAARATRYVFEVVAGKYASGELAFEGIESFAGFRRRVESFLVESVFSTERGSTVVLYSSGGPVAVIAGLALGLSDAKVMDLIGMVHNASWTELRFTRDRLSLEAFNVHPHLVDAERVTFV